MCHAAGVSRAVNGSNSDCVILIEVTKKTIVLLKVTKDHSLVKSYQKTLVLLNNNQKDNSSSKLAERCNVIQNSKKG